MEWSVWLWENVCEYGNSCWPCSGCTHASSVFLRRSLPVWGVEGKAARWGRGREAVTGVVCLHTQDSAYHVNYICMRVAHTHTHTHTHTPHPPTHPPTHTHTHTHSLSLLLTGNLPPCPSQSSDDMQLVKPASHDASATASYHATASTSYDATIKRPSFDGSKLASYGATDVEPSGLSHRVNSGHMGDWGILRVALAFGPHTCTCIIIV